MKTMSRCSWRALSGLLSAAFVLTGSSCMTTYDGYGRPVQSVDPGAAIVGVAAAGLIGYSLADGHHHGYRGGYYRHCAPRPRYYGCH